MFKQIAAHAAAQAGWRLALIAMILLSTTSGARAATPVPFDQAAIDRFITTQMAAHRIEGLALAITQGDKVLAVRGYGSARDSTPVSGQTQFMIASLSKSFTALAVLQLVEAGRVALDAPVQRYLPDFTTADPDAAAHITVRHLLNHTSGLNDAGFASGLTGQQTTLAARVDSLRDARPVSAPGTAFHYFDPNYQILARLVEVVSGEPLGAYLQQHIFVPLAMYDTFSAVTSDEAIARATNMAQSHIVVYGVPIAMQELSGLMGGSGGVVSTAADMAHYLAMQGAGGQYNGVALVGHDALELTHRPPSGVASNYGMGWLVGNVNGVRTIEHNGIFSTWYAETALLPESGYSFVLLYDEYALSAAALAFPRMKEGLVAILTGHEPPSGGLTVPLLGGIFAALTLLGVGLALRSLARLPRWAARLAATPRWRRATGIVGTFAPAMLLLCLPHLLAASSGRYFGYVMLTRAMPDIMIWLGSCAALGLINGVLRVVVLVREGRRSYGH